MADSYINAAAREPGAAADLAASRKEKKYADLDGRYTFEPIAIETVGVLNTSARQLLCDLGRKSRGPRTKPWGTSHEEVWKEERLLSHLTRKERDDK